LTVPVCVAVSASEPVMFGLVPTPTPAFRPYRSLRPSRPARSGQTPTRACRACRRCPGVSHPLHVSSTARGPQTTKSFGGTSYEGPGQYPGSFDGVSTRFRG